ncbi:MAG: thioredoxin family protein [Phycisphaerae bacterium]|nr:thioredoxin family protein [Phycisphaerae bacterium]
MKRNSYKLAAVSVILIAMITGIAVANTPEPVKTVEKVYPNLAAGVLTYAKVSALPDGVLLKSEGVEITSNNIDKFISGQAKQLQAELKKNAFFVLEQQATGEILKQLVSKKLTKKVNLTDDKQLLSTFFEELTKDIKVTEKDVETFYRENESVFCGTPLKSVRKQIESYVLQDNKQRFIDQYIQTLGQKIEIVVSDSWTKQQAVSSKDNLLDKARAEGKPTLAIFSAASCCGPDKMIPVRDALLKKYDKKINVVYIEPKKQQILAARYGIRSIPSQVFYDNKGKEYFRHSGFYSEKDITGKLTEMEVK